MRKDDFQKNAASGGDKESAAKTTAAPAKVIQIAPKLAGPRAPAPKPPFGMGSMIMANSTMPTANGTMPTATGIKILPTVVKNTQDTHTAMEDDNDQ